MSRSFFVYNLNDAIDDDPYNLPEYTTPEGLVPGPDGLPCTMSVVFRIGFEKNSDNGEILTQDQLPAYTGPVPDKPVDTNEGNVTPHSSVKPNKGSDHAKTSGVHAAKVTKAASTNTTSTVHAATVSNNHAAFYGTASAGQSSLPQTGAHDNMFGLVGLMFASLGAILDLAGTKRRKD